MGTLSPNGVIGREVVAEDEEGTQGKEVGEKILARNAFAISSLRYSYIFTF